MVLKCYHTNCLLVTRVGESESNYIMEKLDKLTDLYKLTSPPPDIISWERHSFADAVFLSRMHNLNLITREHQTNPKLGILCF